MTIVYEIDKDLKEIVPGFLKSREKDIDLIKKAIEEKDFEEIRSIGHKLKGTSGSYGFMDLSKIGAEMEQAGKSSDLEAIKKLASEYKNHLEQIEVKYI